MLVKCLVFYFPSDVNVKQFFHATNNVNLRFGVTSSVPSASCLCKHPNLFLGRERHKELVFTKSVDSNFRAF